jgi:hypothetical protein
MLAASFSELQELLQGNGKVAILYLLIESLQTAKGMWAIEGERARFVPRPLYPCHSWQNQPPC